MVDELHMHQSDALMNKTLAGGEMQPPLTVAVQQVLPVGITDVHMVTFLH